MRTGACPCCGLTEGRHLLWRLPDYLWFPDRYFSLVRCRDCRFVFLDPAPDEATLATHYPGHYYARSVLPQPVPAAFRWRLNQLAQKSSTGRLLDVGCGEGFFLVAAREEQWDGYGVELVRDAVAVAQQYLGDRVRAGTLSEARYPSAHFTVVTLFEVLEHLPAPIEQLQEVYRVLRPGGRVYVSVPNFASLERRLLGRWWVGLDAPRHLQQFTRHSLQRVLASAGFQDIRVRSVNASCVQRSKRPITYYQESVRYLLRAAGWYPGPQGKLDASEAEPVADLRPGWKSLVHAAEWVLYMPLVCLARSLDMDNTLWAVAKRP